MHLQRPYPAVGRPLCLHLHPPCPAPRRSDFDRLVQQYACAEEQAARREDELARSFALPTTAAPGLPGDTGKRLLRKHGRRRRERSRVQRSIFGLPTFDPAVRWFVWWGSIVLLLDLTYRCARVCMYVCACVCSRVRSEKLLPLALRLACRLTCPP